MPPPPLAAQIWAPLIRLPLLPKQFYKRLVYTNLLFCYCSSILQRFVQGIFRMVLALPRLLVLSKKQLNS